MLFEDVWNTNEIRDFICDVSEQESCSEVNVGMSHRDCVQKLEELPGLSNNGSFDGNSYGCRAMHAVFAAKNSHHCAHLSFEPQEDASGQIKCQKPSGKKSLDYFDAEDLEDFRDFLEEKGSFIEDRIGYKILERPKETNTTMQIIFGMAVPILIFCVSYLVMRKKKTEKEKATDKDSDVVNALLTNKAKQLWTLIAVILLSLVVAAGLAALAVWLVTIKYPDWDSYPTSDDELEDRYRGSTSRVGETAPQFIMSDDQLAVYTGVMVWLTALLSGLGMEVFCVVPLSAGLVRRPRDTVAFRAVHLSLDAGYVSWASLVA